MAGLAQKGGSVWSHLQIAADPSDIKTVRLGSGGARLVLAATGGVRQPEDPGYRRTSTRVWPTLTSR